MSDSEKHIDIPQSQDEDSSPLMAFSPKAIQAFYNEITGKTEEISRNYHRLYQLEFGDFEQLHIKIQQALEQYSVVGHTQQLTIFHADETKEKFSSFERFKIFNQSNPTPTEAVIFKYNVLILQPDIKKTQNYEIYIRVASNIVVNERLQKDVPPELWDIIRWKNAYVRARAKIISHF